MIFESLITRETFGLVAGAIGAGLFGFGLLFDRITEHLERIGWAHGRSSLLVITGTLVTLLAAIPLIGLRATLVVLALFACSGLPMAAGQIIRHQRNLHNYMRRLQEIDGHGA